MKFAWITTLRADGSPRTTRVWFAETPGALWIATSAANRKVGDLRRDPRMTLAVEGSDRALNARATIAPITLHPEVVELFSRATTDGM